eukprot:SAG22_NODE_11479_length_483_cov_0.614583_1_plen_69_part_10
MSALDLFDKPSKTPSMVRRGPIGAEHIPRTPHPPLPRGTASPAAADAAPRAHLCLLSPLAARGSAIRDG